MRETVMIVMYDLPVRTRRMRQKSSQFRNGLKKLGYSLLQKSVYYKLISNVTSCCSERKEVRQLAPRNGDVKFLPVSIKQFMKMTSLAGPPFPFEKLLCTVIEK